MSDQMLFGIPRLRPHLSEIKFRRIAWAGEVGRSIHGNKWI
jgi:hypothetical protein